MTAPSDEAFADAGAVIADILQRHLLADEAQHASLDAAA